ncbi:MULTISPECIES: hemolysin family protein [Olivibacter]|uniref:HlyC/CorC family transporter n=3 Tax=Sphingobacteriaceae TaxID=84566 RepID=F4C565_SPHS2|nr:MULTISPECIES: hemolysin family protein [Olivibacter]MCL4639470.1 hemolysin family protein [Olivibacter sp. UJ_SKK_5.1]QEL00179.1 HlyC/CorC family transporter [Olivibacter sp. LS-1]
MGFQIFVTLFLVVLNGFFVAAEFAIVKVRLSQIEVKAKSGNSVAKVAKHITQHLDGYLAATQLGITLASLGLGWVGESVMTEIVNKVFGLFNVELTGQIATNLGHVLAFSIITVLHIVFGELAPKSIAIQRPVGTTMALSLPLRFFYIIFRPFIWILNGFANFILRLLGFGAHMHEAHHSTEELQYLLDQGKESGALNMIEHELIKNVFDFNERVVKNIMVPRTKIVGIELSSPKEELLQTIISEGYSRIPVYDETIDKIVGIVHAKDILPLMVNNKEFVLKTIIRKPYFIAENKKINDLMSEFQLKRIQIAIVLDEFGGTAGMVTLEDIVEELVGEIQDEYDEEKPIVEKASDTEYIVEAAASVHDVNEYLPYELPESSDYDTLSGLVITVFDKIPDVGERKEFHGYIFTILKKTQQNIEYVKLESLPRDSENMEEED